MSKRKATSQTQPDKSEKKGRTQRILENVYPKSLSPDTICVSMEYSVNNLEELKAASEILLATMGKKDQLKCLQQLFNAWNIPGTFKTDEEAFKVYFENTFEGKRSVRSKLRDVPLPHLVLYGNVDPDLIIYVDSLKAAFNREDRRIFDALENKDMKTFERLIKESKTNLNFDPDVEYIEFDNNVEIPYSWLQLAINLRNPEAVKILLDQGASFTTKGDPSGVWETLAIDTADRKHSRPEWRTRNRRNVTPEELKIWKSLFDSGLTRKIIESTDTVDKDFEDAPPPILRAEQQWKKEDIDQIMKLSEY